jgi:LmeA-like phospholipid-binding
MRRIAAFATAAFVIGALVVAQLVLPGIAQQRLRDRLSRSGTVLKVQVQAFPAIKLLWHRADKVVIQMANYRSSTGHLGGLLDQAADVGSLDASAQVLTSGLLTLRDASLTKRGDELVGRATVTEADLRAAVPFLDSVQPVASDNGQLTLRGTATLLGVTATVDATVGPQGGHLVVTPDVPFGGLATVTVFSDPHVEIQSVTASSVPGGFSVTARARVR